MVVNENPSYVLRPHCRTGVWHLWAAVNDFVWCGDGFSLLLRLAVNRANETVYCRYYSCWIGPIRNANGSVIECEFFYAEKRKFFII
jgi:hypothetical protein